MTLAQQINSMVERLPETEQVVLFELVKCLLPDDIATPSDLVAIAAAREQYKRGEAVPDSAINWG